VCYTLDYRKKESNVGQEEKSNSSPMDERKFAYVEDDGKSQSWRHKNSEIIKENPGRNERHGSQAWDIAEYARLRLHTGPSDRSKNSLERLRAIAFYVTAVP
jgi:hypothetical protein